MVSKKSSQEPWERGPVNSVRALRPREVKSLVRMGRAAGSDPQPEVTALLYSSLAGLPKMREPAGSSPCTQQVFIILKMDNREGCGKEQG